jgi:hypothetical protein
MTALVKPRASGWVAGLGLAYLRPGRTPGVWAGPGGRAVQLASADLENFAGFAIS